MSIVIPFASADRAVHACTMMAVEDLTEPLINGNLPTMASTVITAAENYRTSTKALSNGHGNNGHVLEAEKGRLCWMWGEVREQLWLAGPITGMYFLQYVMSLAAIVFLGHLGSLPLAAYTLANAFASMTGFTVLAGLASALETLCGQAYGAKQYHLLGIFLQRAIILLAVASAPIVLIWLNMGRFLVAVGEDPEVAGAAQSYCAYWLLPLLVLYAVLSPLTKFFQTQHAVFQLMLCTAVTAFLCHLPLCWLLIDKLALGLNGAGIVWTLANSVNLCLLVCFVRFSPRFQKTFSSLSWDAFEDFGEFVALAIPSATMMCLENWSQEFLTLVAGLLPNSKLNISSFGICMGLLASSNMIALALGVAASVRVSNELGAGKAVAARAAVAVSMVMGVVDGTVMASFIYSLRDTWGWAFTNDVQVVHHVAQTAPYLAGLALLYAIAAVLSGVVRGIGWQRMGAIANLGAYYAVGLPVALISVFAFNFDARGLWLGMGCGLVTQIGALICIILCPNWDHLAEEALLRSSSRLPTSTPLLKPLQEEGHSPEDFQNLSTEA